MCGVEEEVSEAQSVIRLLKKHQHDSGLQIMIHAMKVIQFIDFSFLHSL